MRKMILLLSLAFGGAAISLAATDPEDIRVDLPEELMPKPKPRTEYERKQDILRARVNSKLPYMYRGDLALGTFGQLSKLCDNVIVGKVINVTEDQTESAVKLLEITFGVETNLFGAVSNKTIKANLRDANRIVNFAKHGDRILVFLANDICVNDIYDAIAFDFKKTSSQVKTNGISHVVCDERGVFALKDDVMERELLVAAEGYLSALRREKRNAEQYYNLLRKLMVSPIPRVKEDARSDMFLLISKDKSFDLQRLLEDKNIDDGIKDYVRLILLPSRQPQAKP
jgi:hypothetical protein